MIGEFLSWPVVWRLGVAMAWSIVVWHASKHYTKGKDSITKKSDFFTAPLSTSFSVVGLLTPLVVGGAAFIVTNHPGQTVAYLLAAAAVLLVVLGGSVWLSFSLPSLTAVDDTITLDLSRDSFVLRMIALVYGNLLLAIVFMALFGLFEFNVSAWRGEGTKPVAGVVEQPILRPVVRIGMRREDIVKTWGKPAREVDSIASYDTPEGSITLTYDREGRMTRMLEQAKVASDER